MNKVFVMKKYLLSLLLLTIIGIFSSCSDNEDEINTPVSEVITVTLNVDEVIDTLETPMTRSYTSDDLIGIQVYKGDEHFAYGVFQIGREMKLDLYKGAKYNFEYTVVKEALKYDSYMYQNPPFRPSQGISSVSYNHFKYDSYRYNSLDGLGYGNAYTPLDRYYGEYQNYSPVQNGQIILNVKRTAFGMRFKVTGITDGTVTVTCKNSSRTFFTKTTPDDFTSEDLIFTWNDVKTAYQYGDSYSESVNLSITWVRGLGITQDLGTKTVTINNNAMNIFNISLGSDDGGAALGLVLENNPFSFESSSFKPWL